MLVEEVWAPPRPPDLGSQAVKTLGMVETAPVAHHFTRALPDGLSAGPHGDGEQNVLGF